LTTALTPQPDIVSCACHSRLTPQFGVKLPNAQLLADEYAEQGKFYVIAPDLANDDWIDHGLLKVSRWHAVFPVDARTEHCAAKK